MGAFLTSLLWLSLSAGATGGKPVDATRIDTAMIDDKADEGPTTDEIDAALTLGQARLPDRMDDGGSDAARRRHRREPARRHVQCLAQRRPRPQCDRHHGAPRHPRRRRAPGRSREAVLQRGRRRNHRLRPLRGRPLDLLLRPSRLCARAREGQSPRAIRSAASARPATPIPPAPTSTSPSTAWPRAQRWYQGRPIDPYPLLAGTCAAAKARANSFLTASTS